MTTYSVRVRCGNCGTVQLLDVLQGITVLEHIKNPSVKCSMCKCRVRQIKKK